MKFLEFLLTLIFGHKLPKGPTHNDVPPSRPGAPSPPPAQPEQHAPPPSPPAASPSAPAPHPEGAGGGAGGFLATLHAVDKGPLKHADYVAAATALGCEPEAVMAVVAVESGKSGFASDGRPLILFEPHIFSRLTKRAYDQSHPKVSYVNWDKSKYPGTQDGRWAQLAEAAELDLENAVASASWGRFQIMGFNYPRCGFSSARDFVAFMSQSEAKQLEAFQRFVINAGIADELARLDWAGFALVYNGKGYAANKYDTRLADNYAKFKAKPAGV
jgi:N-acetylmuramidase